MPRVEGDVAVERADDDPSFGIDADSSVAALVKRTRPDDGSVVVISNSPRNRRAPSRTPCIAGDRLAESCQS